MSHFLGETDMKKKIIALALTVIMLATLGSTAFAAFGYRLEDEALISRYEENGFTIDFAVPYYAGLTTSTLVVDDGLPGSVPARRNFSLILLPEDVGYAIETISVVALPAGGGDLTISQGIVFKDGASGEFFGNVEFSWGSGGEIGYGNDAVKRLPTTHAGISQSFESGERVALPLDSGLNTYGVRVMYFRFANNDYFADALSTCIILTPDMANQVMESGYCTDPADGRLLPLGDYFPELPQMISNYRNGILPEIPQGEVEEPVRAARPTSSRVIVNGVEKVFDAYNIMDNNYFKLRDIAYVLNGTEAQFAVIWDGERDAIRLTTGMGYTPVGGEMTGKGQGEKTAMPTQSNVFLDGATISLKAYNILNNNYFKLRDLGAAFRFEVDWDEETQTIFIDTSRGYTPD